ncbi:hypothetical protein JOM56_011574 [Amanita muscaria]
MLKQNDSKDLLHFVVGLVDETSMEHWHEPNPLHFAEVFQKHLSNAENPPFTPSVSAKSTVYAQLQMDPMHVVQDGRVVLLPSGTQATASTPQTMGAPIYLYHPIFSFFNSTSRICYSCRGLEAQPLLVISIALDLVYFLLTISPLIHFPIR